MAQTTQQTVQLTGVAEFIWRERCGSLGSRVYKHSPHFSFSKEYLCCWKVPSFILICIPIQSVAWKAADKRPPMKNHKEIQQLRDCQLLTNTPEWLIKGLTSVGAGADRMEGQLKGGPRTAFRLGWSWKKPTLTSSPSAPWLGTVVREFCPIFCFNWSFSLLFCNK